MLLYGERGYQMNIYIYIITTYRNLHFLRWENIFRGLLLHTVSGLHPSKILKINESKKLRRRMMNEKTIIN